jgi:hypothetical protein
MADGHASQVLVIGVMAASPPSQQNQLIKGAFMPILMVALVALGTFLAIGILLGSAVILEHRNKNKA